MHFSWFLIIQNVLDLNILTLFFFLGLFFLACGKESDLPLVVERMFSSQMGLLVLLK